MAAEPQENAVQQDAPQPAISIGDIHDPNGVTLVGEADEAIQRVEDYFQQALTRTGDLPEKPAKVVIELEIMATGPAGRSIDYKVDTKYPSTAVKRSQFAASDGTHIVPVQMPKQYRADFSTGEPK